MDSGHPLAALFQVKQRFARSVNIVADYGSADAVTEYILTPLVRTVLRRVGEGLRPGSRTRAWSITGPYGSGKSACALFLARVLGSPIDGDARSRLKCADESLYRDLMNHVPSLAERGLLVVPIVGARQPLAAALLRGLMQAIPETWLTAAAGARLQRQIEALERDVHGAIEEPVASIVELVESTAQLATRQHDLGMLIILDEFGKLLEYAALNPARGDIYLLQALAELAARSAATPIGLITILHQSFEWYGARLGLTQQREWAKVQGRFEDIGFLESPGEVLRLVSSAIVREPLGAALEGDIQDQSVQAQALALVPRELGQQEGADILSRCAPLHPTVALVLGRLFRSRLAQNERSLFAFLTSGEPHGLQEFLLNERSTGNGHIPFYRLDRLYDYVNSAMGSALYAQSQGKRWAEIEDALDRLPPDAGRLEAAVIKSIGLLGLLGDQRNLKASSALVTYALADGNHVREKDVEHALDRLSSWGIVLYRRHKEAYGLWEGSDIDLDERFQKGLDQIDRSASLATLLQRRLQLRPYVAKRHLHQTGTLRYFAPWIVDIQGIGSVLQRPLDGADGAVFFVLGNGESSPNEATQIVLQASSTLEFPHKHVLFFAVPRNVAGIREALEEVLAWDWVAQNTPELEGDRTARRELAGRQLEAFGRLNALCAHTFDRASGEVSSVWIQAGQILPVRRPSDIQAALSDACDRAYHAAPIVRNELANRRTLSSSAAAARRNLIERMLTAPDRPRLGIEGFPPELSMYRSVLESSGLHHKTGSGWTFGFAGNDDPGHVSALWQAVDEFLASTEAEKRSVADLFALLQAPPYGVRLGLLPIYLAAAVLCWDQEVALYENGSFIPKVDIAAFERLMKSPEQFSLQRYRLAEARAFLFEAYSSLLRPSATPGLQATLLSAVRPLVAFVKQLPAYTHRTSSVSTAAASVRDAILCARDPHQLLFEDLPRAVGSEPISADAELTVAQAFFARLKSALIELQRAYDNLLQDVQHQLVSTLRLPGDIRQARLEIGERTRLFDERVTDPRLKAFVVRLSAITRLVSSQSPVGPCLSALRVIYL